MIKRYTENEKVYLALGDSMSIDNYTGVSGGGAASQLYRRLNDSWTLKDLTFDGCTMKQVSTSEVGGLITLTICGNDALLNIDYIITNGVDLLIDEHLKLLKAIRSKNPNSCLIIGNIYSPQLPLDKTLSLRLKELNEGISQNTAVVNGLLADIYSSFKGNEDEYLCQDIEPNLKGATTIAESFYTQFNNWKNKQISR